MRQLREVVTSKHAVAILAIVGFGIAIYQTWFQERRPALTFEIVSNATVLDVHTPVKGLEIIYLGENLRATKQELRLMIVRMTNSGQTYISKKDYDEAAPLGFRVLHAKLLEAPVITSQRNYLSEYLKISQVRPDKLIFSPVILDPNDSVQIQYLAVAPAGQTPTIEPFGKVAGVKALELVDTEQVAQKKPWWQKILESDSPLASIWRWGMYLVGVLTAFLGAAIVLSVLSILFHVYSDYKNRARRSELLLEYTHDRPLSDADKWILDQFRIGGFGRMFN